jgi:hypothetical protein
VCGGEGVLDDVLALLVGSQQVPAESQDSRAVPLEGHLEGRLVAQADLLDEPVVTPERENALRAERPDPTLEGYGQRAHA